jgi:hypothetical protein
MAHIHAAKESDVNVRSRSRDRDRVREKQRPGHLRGVLNMTAAKRCTLAATWYYHRPMFGPGILLPSCGAPTYDAGPIPLARSCEARACDSELKKAGPREAVVLMPSPGTFVGCEVPH